MAFFGKMTMNHWTIGSIMQRRFRSGPADAWSWVLRFATTLRSDRRSGSGDGSRLNCPRSFQCAFSFGAQGLIRSFWQSVQVEWVEHRKIWQNPTLSYGPFDTNAKSHMIWQWLKTICPIFSHALRKDGSIRTLSMFWWLQPTPTHMVDILLYYNIYIM